MKPEEYCITTVVVGDRYRKMLDVFMKSYHRFENMPQMLVVSESPEMIKHDNILTTGIGDNPIKVNGDFNMCLKRLAFQHAIDRGFEKMIFIDIDRTHHIIEVTAEDKHEVRRKISRMMPQLQNRVQLKKGFETKEGDNAQYYIQQIYTK